jgi:hypothetical protein
MGRCVGGSAVEGKLEELRVALYDYYGGLEEIKANARSKPPEMPEALIIYKQCEALGLPLAEGGLLDQPHIWLLEVGVIKQVTDIFEVVNAAPIEQPQGQANADTTRPI